MKRCLALVSALACAMALCACSAHPGGTTSPPEAAAAKNWGIVLSAPLSLSRKSL